jgi:CRP-like cAMP-binding protein/tRNA A-37 threonylcarbamoyl transferase component Bud32
MPKSSSPARTGVTAPANAVQTRARGLEPSVAEAGPSDRFELRTTVEIRSFIAAGGMAKVYRAHDHGLDRTVAMKALAPNAPEAIRASFEREAKLMARLDHPGIVGVYGLSGSELATRVFTMKLVEGQTLAAIIDEDGPPRGRALAVILRGILRMCETLSYAHDHGVIHRDLKPANVMLGRYGECYTMDWGVAYEREPNAGAATTIDQPGDIIGTPAFMAPEQALGRTQDIDARTDVFGVGAILYYVLIGRPPYSGGNITGVLAAACEGRVAAPELTGRGQGIPARLSDIVIKALQPEREDRFQSVKELHAALEQFLFTGEWFARRRFGNDTLIVREGERGDRAYIVESGECEAFRQGEGGEIKLRRIGPGEVIGEVALFATGERTASVRALTPVTLLEVTREALELELPTGSWTRQILDTVVQRFLSMDEAWESLRGQSDASRSDHPSPSGGGEVPRDRSARVSAPVRAPAPPEREPVASEQLTPLFVAKIIGATVALTGAGLLLLKLVASLLA